MFSSLTALNHIGMHKHFRMIAISEHLRNHGFDPDHYKHTRIPFIWQKLRTYYNLDMIDERENFEDEDEPEDKYKEFSLPRADFYEAMMQRAIADPSEAPTSPAQLDLDAEVKAPAVAAAPAAASTPVNSSPPKKRKRGETTSRTRATSSAREDTEDVTDAQSPATRSVRGSTARGRTRASNSVAKADKADKAETTEEEEDEDEEDDGEEEEGDDDDDEEEGEGGDNEESGSAEEDDGGQEDSGSERATQRQAAKPSRRGGRPRGRGRSRAGRRRGR